MTDGFVCQYCNKSFQKERTLVRHICEQKRRWLNKNEKYVLIGFEAFRQFYKIAMGDSKPKDYETFSKSQYYLSFTKFGKYMEHLDAVEPEKFIEFVIKMSVPLDKWTSDAVYNQYLLELYKRETATRALERGVLLMQEWSEQNDKPFNQFFNEITNSRAVHWIRSGRISPWIIFNCDTGLALLGRFSDEEMELIKDYMNPAFWQQKFDVRKSDVEFVQGVLEQAGL